MKNLVIVLAIMGVLTLLTAGASAQVAKPEPKPVLTAIVEEMKTVLKLSDEQVKKMTDLIAETEKTKADMAKEFEPVKAEYDKAKAANDDAGIKAATEKWTALYKRQAEVNTKGGADIGSVLTADQLVQWREHKYLEPILGTYKKASLTDDQVAKIKVEFKRCMDEEKPDDTKMDWQYRMKISNKLTGIIQKDILTDPQRETMVLEPILAQYKSANLTDAQVAKIKEQLAKLTKDAKPDDQPWTIGMKLGAFIQKEVLTDEQREKSFLEPFLSQYKKAELTDEQVTKIKDKYKELVKEAKPDDAPYAMQMKIGSFLMKEVLTDDQKTKMGMKMTPK